MSLIIEFDPEAELEYRDAYEWYGRKSIMLATRFETAIEGKLNLIVKSPLHYPSKKLNYRECKVTNFPFLIVYKIIADKQVVYISSIFNTNRDPGTKYRK